MQKNFGQINSGHINSVQEQRAKNSVTLELVDRQMLRLNGVNNVDVFDEEQIILQTELGKLEIKGHHLNVTNLDVENGDLQVDGIIDSFVYLEEEQSRGKKNHAKKSAGKAGRGDGFMARLFS